MVPTASTVPLVWKPAERPGSWISMDINHEMINISQGTAILYMKINVSQALFPSVNTDQIQSQIYCKYNITVIHWTFIFVVKKNKGIGNLDGLAPERLVGVNIPQVDLLVLSTCHKLFSAGVHIQSPQLICVTLSGKHFETEHSIRRRIMLCFLIIRIFAIYLHRTWTIGVRAPEKEPCRIAFLVVPTNNSSCFPSATVRTGPKASGTFIKAHKKIKNHILLLSFVRFIPCLIEKWNLKYCERKKKWGWKENLESNKRFFHVSSSLTELF